HTCWAQGQSARSRRVDTHDDVRAGSAGRGTHRRSHRDRRPCHDAGQLSRVERVTDGEEPMAPFAGWRIVELSSGIAASYCGKMFTDAGADVVKIEPPQGDPMRQWSAGGAPGALFGYLAAGKRSVLRGDAEMWGLIASADLVLTDLTDGWSWDELVAHAGLSAVSVAITPFGTFGPYVDQQVV